MTNWWARWLLRRIPYVRERHWLNSFLSCATCILPWRYYWHDPYGPFGFAKCFIGGQGCDTCMDSALFFWGFRF